MNIKFVLGGLFIIGALIFFNDWNYKNTLEEKFRETGKSLNTDSGLSTSIEGYSVDAKLLNQYPHLIVNMTFKPFNKLEFP